MTDSPLTPQRPHDWAQRMKEDWNARAEQNAMHYILTKRADWTLQEFLATGERDVARFVDPFLAQYPSVPRGSVLELGCGLGRLSAALATRFSQVDAIDVSEVMVQKAAELHAALSHVKFVANNGKDLSGFPSDEYDFVFSYIVLQHIPDPDIILGYVREFGRVLRTGGLFLFQVSNNEPQGHKAYVRRWEHRRQAYRERDELIPFEDYNHALLADKVLTFETIIQTPVGLEETFSVLRESGMRVDSLSGEGTDLLWLAGQKEAAS